MKDVQITVEGEAGTGKSTILAIVEKALAGQGFDVEVASEARVEPLEKRLARAHDPSLAASVSKSVRINLTEKQTARVPG